MGEDTVIHTVATQEDLLDLRKKLYEDLSSMKEQIAVLQARSSALEAQLARIEPMVEARNSRTEKMVLELQLDINKLHKSFGAHELRESTHQSKIEEMLTILVSRGE